MSSACWTNPRSKNISAAAQISHQYPWHLQIGPNLSVFGIMRLYRLFIEINSDTIPIKKRIKLISSTFCRFMPKTMSIKTVSLVAESLGMIQFIPNRRLPWQNFPSTAFRIPSSFSVFSLRSAVTSVSFWGRKGALLIRIPYSFHHWRLAMFR